jgi:hypothetical protein
MGGGMMGMGGGMMGMGGNNANLLQLQLFAEFGAVPVNGLGGMMGFAGKAMGGGFNGGNGL